MQTPEQARHNFTLAQLRACYPCEDGWTKLLTGLGKKRRDNKDLLISIGDIAMVNGASDAMWSLRALPDRRMIIRAVMPAVIRASAHTTDARVHDCIAAIQQWLNGDDSVDLHPHAVAARSAVSAASAAARSTASEAACAAYNAVYAVYAAANAACDADYTAVDYTAADDAAAYAVYAANIEHEREYQRADLIALFGTTIEKETG